MSRTALAFDAQCMYAGLPVPLAEYRFHPARKWRFDWAWPSTQPLAVEVEGGAWITGGGRHTRGAGFEADLEKYREAMFLGWRILRVSPAMIADGRAVGYVERLLKTADL